MIQAAPLGALGRLREGPGRRRPRLAGEVADPRDVRREGVGAIDLAQRVGRPRGGERLAREGQVPLGGDLDRHLEDEAPVGEPLRLPLPARPGGDRALDGLAEGGDLVLGDRVVLRLALAPLLRVALGEALDVGGGLDPGIDLLGPDGFLPAGARARARDRARAGARPRGRRRRRQLGLDLARPLDVGVRLVHAPRGRSLRGPVAQEGGRLPAHLVPEPRRVGDGGPVAPERRERRLGRERIALLEQPPRLRAGEADARDPRPLADEDLLRLRRRVEPDRLLEQPDRALEVAGREPPLGLGEAQRGDVRRRLLEAPLDAEVLRLETLGLAVLLEGRLVLAAGEVLVAALLLDGATAGRRGGDGAEESEDGEARHESRHRVPPLRVTGRPTLPCLTTRSRSHPATGCDRRSSHRVVPPSGLERRSKMQERLGHPEVAPHPERNLPAAGAF